MRNRIFLSATLFLSLSAPCVQAQTDIPLLGEVRLERLPELDSEAEERLPDRAVLFGELLQSAIVGPASRGELAESYGDLGRLYHVWGLERSATVCYRNARSLAPRDSRWPYYLGGLQHSQGRFVDALASWIHATAVRATSVGLYRMSETLLRLDRIDEAVAVLENARALDPSSAAIPVALARISLRRQRPREAVDHLQSALSLEPDADLLHKVLAPTYRQLGETELAENSEALAGDRGTVLRDPLRDELATFRNEERIALLEGDLAVRAGRLEQARIAYSRASESSVAARHRLGMTLLALDRPDEARTAFRAALELAPDDTSVLESLGFLLLEQGEIDMAVEHLALAVSLAPDRANLQLNLAEALVARGQLEESLPYFTATARLAPQESRAWLGGIRTLIALDRQAEAAEVLSVALAALPDNAEIARLQEEVRRPNQQ